MAQNTNPTRLSRTARDVAWNPLPGDAIRLPGGYLTTMSSARDARERFLKALAQAPAGSTVVPYDGRYRSGLGTGADTTACLVSRDMRNVSWYLPELLDRWSACGFPLSPEALAALDFTATLPEAPFVYHAANIVHCMVKFGAPAFVAAKPARDPRQNPQPGDRRIPARGLTGAPWVWTANTGDAYLPHWRDQDGGVVWECAESAPAKAPRSEPGLPYGYTTRYFAQPIPIMSVDWAPGRSSEGCAVDLSDFMRKFLSNAPAPRRCPRTDPKPGDLCIAANDAVEVFKEGAYKLRWGIGGSRTRWIRGEDIVRG